jgi:serine kinase of HPr protein (carbohydrate metabolism regulator)
VIPQTACLHASCVALDGEAVLIRGASGSGKSALALRLIDAGGVLVADDRTIVTAGSGPDGRLRASAPAAIAGRLEVRGLGIVRLAHAPAPVGLIVDLAPAAAIDRMPAPDDLMHELCGTRLPRIMLDASLPGATARVRLALGLAGEGFFTSGEALVSSPEG